MNRTITQDRLDLAKFRARIENHANRASFWANEAEREPSKRKIALAMIRNHTNALFSMDTANRLLVGIRQANKMLDEEEEALMKQVGGEDGCQVDPPSDP